MSVLFVYLLKLSLSLSVVFIFYQLVLRRLTFYNWNRVYLLGYTLLSFVIPFVDISPVLERNSLTESNIITWVPAIGSQNQIPPVLTEAGKPVISGWDIALITITAGMIVLLLKLLFQLISYSKMKTKATWITVNGLNIYQVEENIIPFSFGNSIFINRNLHTEAELQEIIRHEFIHVKQKHSLDIIWSELLCLVNWYNPFAWLLKKSIRQNLEFIADNKVIETGISKKEYQYLLLKVTGNNQYSIATQFNFSSLKKRIAMMNKTKSTKQQVTRFLFLLPVLAIILISFRKSFTDSAAIQKGNSTPVFTDTVPEAKEVNSKGYFIGIKDNKGNCVVVIKDKDKKEVKRLLLTEWNEKADYYENLYGEIPPPPPPPPPPAPKSKPGKPDAPANFDLDGKKMTVTNKDGATTVYDLADPVQKIEFQTLYGNPAVASVDVKSVAEVAVAGRPVASTKGLQAVVEEEKPITTKTIKAVKIAETAPGKPLIAEEVMVAEKPLKVSGEFKEIKVEGKPVFATVKSAKPALKNEKAAVDDVVVVEKPILYGTKTMAADVNLVFEEKPIKEPDILKIGGLSMKDEQQYILVDGKEYSPKPGDTLKGKFRITFMEKSEAVKKYGEKAKNGAIIAETIK